ncbi:MAG: hypothetical protein LBQ61_04480 [Spirochaetales bacterium]|jgi:hypothetical protein|nr:hypothetical protein [Spirochaetales bacterium]
MTTIKKGFLLAAVLMAAAFPAFSQAPSLDLNDIQSGIGSAAETLGEALILNSTLGLSWSDSHIGQLIALPPHFGVGISAGATSVQAQGVSDFLNTLGVDTSDLFGPIPGDSFYLPRGNVEGRIGGFLLPFDIGVKGMYLPAVGSDTKLEFTSLGADIRFALIKNRLIIPGISLAAGASYTTGGVSRSLGTTQHIDLSQIQGFSSGDGLDLSAPELDFHWKNITLDARVQASWNLIAITPYVGAGASYGWSTVGYGLNSTVTKTGTWSGTTEDLNNNLTNAGLDPVNLDSASGLSYETKYEGLAFRAFGGVSLNILIVKLDLSLIYDFVNKVYGANAGVRIQI